MTQVEKAKKFVEEKANQCNGITKAGARCKSKASKDGFCSAHHPNKKKKKGKAKLAEPVGGEDVLTQLIDATVNPDSGVDVPVTFPVDPVLKEVMDRAETVVADKEAVVNVDPASAMEDQVTPEERAAALAELVKYEDILVYLAEGFKDKHPKLTLYIAEQVSALSNEEVSAESEAVTKYINKLSYEVKEVRRNARDQYGVNFPLDVHADIAKRDFDIYMLQAQKAMLLARIDMVQKVKPVFKAPKDKKPSMMDTMKRWLKYAPAGLIISGILAILIALAYMLGDMSTPDADPSDQGNPPVVVEETPAPVQVEVPVAGGHPVDVGTEDAATPEAPVAGGHPVDVDEVITITPVAVDTVVVEDGNTLWTIAEEVYGDGSMWTVIYDANADMLNADDARNVQNPGHWIYAGQVLDIPTNDELARNDH